MGINERHLLIEIVGGGRYMVCLIILAIVLLQEFYAHYIHSSTNKWLLVVEIGDAAPPYSPTNVQWMGTEFTFWPIHLILISIRWRIDEDEYTYAYSFLHLTCNALMICFALHNLYLSSKVSELIMILYPCFVIMFRVWTTIVRLYHNHAC